MVNLIIWKEIYSNYELSIISFFNIPKVTVHIKYSFYLLLIILVENFFHNFFNTHFKELLSLSIFKTFNIVFHTLHWFRTFRWTTHILTPLISQADIKYLTIWQSLPSIFTQVILQQLYSQDPNQTLHVRECLYSPHAYKTPANSKPKHLSPNVPKCLLSFLKSQNPHL